LHPERWDALDALDASHATCLTRTQFALALCIRTQLATASAYRTERVRAFSFGTQPCQGIFLLDTAVSGHFPSGRSRVRAFSFCTLPCQGKWRLDDACHGTAVVTPGFYCNRSVERIKGNQATFDDSQRNNLRSCVWVRW